MGISWELGSIGMAVSSSSATGNSLMSGLVGWYRMFNKDADPYWSNVILQISGDGTNGSTTITDASPIANALTVGGSAQISTAQVQYGTGSMKFRGEITSDYVRVSTTGTDPKLFSFEKGDFTVEMWVYCTAYNTQSTVTPIYDGRLVSGGVSTQVDLRLSSGVLQYMNGGVSRINHGTSFTLNTWTHIALSRVSGSSRLFVNGTQVGSTYTDTNNFTSVAGAPFIGKLNDNSPTWNGYIDDVRVTKGVGRYTGTFTPPAAAFPVSTGTQALDSSGKGNHGTLVGTPLVVADKYGNAGSAYSFASTSKQCVTLMQTSGLPIYGGGRAYSICTWINASAPSGTWNSFYGEGISADWQPAFYIGVWSTLKLNVFSLRADGTTMVFGNAKSTTTIADGTWHHIVFSDPGTGLAKLYVDGILDATNFSYTSANYTGFESMSQSTVAALRRKTTGGIEGSFDGSLFDFRLYNRALTAAEARTLYAATQRI